MVTPEHGPLAKEWHINFLPHTVGGLLLAEFALTAVELHKIGQHEWKPARETRTLKNLSVFSALLTEAHDDFHLTIVERKYTQAAALYIDAKWQATIPVQQNGLIPDKAALLYSEEYSAHHVGGISIAENTENDKLQGLVHERLGYLTLGLKREGGLVNPTE